MSLSPLNELRLRCPTAEEAHVGIHSILFIEHAVRPAGQSCGPLLRDAENYCLGHHDKNGWGQVLQKRMGSGLAIKHFAVPDASCDP